MFGEAGWTENHDNNNIGFLGGSDSSIDIVPMTFNVKLEHLLVGGLSVYVGGGLGAAYVDGNSDDDWVFASQAFAGLAYHVSDSLEVFGGARLVHFEDPDIGGVSLDNDCLIEGGLRFSF